MSDIGSVRKGLDQKTEKVKEPSSGETIASVADHKDLDERMIRFQALVQGHDCSQEYSHLPGE